MAIAVLTDTTSALPRTAADSWGIRLVPLSVTTGGRRYRDCDVEAAQIAAEPGAVLHTAGPPPGEFISALTAATDAAPGAIDGAVIVTVAQRLSSTYAAARLAAGISGLPIEIVDSGTAAGGQALVAITAAEQARAGGGLAHVAKAAREAAATVRLVGCMRSLDRLVASGRVPGLAGATARRLGLWPMFELSGGAVRPLRPARSEAAALSRIADICARSGDEWGRAGAADVVVLDCGLPNAAARLLERIRQRIRTGVELTSTFGSAMIVHTGTDVVGLAWRWRRDAAGAGLL